MRSGLRFGMSVAAILGAVFIGGCGTAIMGPAITYAYEPQFSFAGSKTYRWGAAKSSYRQDPLVEQNARFAADRALAAKGLTATTGAADLVVWIGYETDASSYGNELRALTLNVGRGDNNGLVWRGTASGRIRTDADSGELTKAVEGMLAKFPPK